MAGDVFGEYRVSGKLGEGTVGSVYRAVHTQTGQEVALKILKPGVAEDPTVQNRFVREVSVLQKLRHPNIVQCYDAGLHDDALYYVMELVEFGSLDEVLQAREILPWRDAVDCAVQVCHALACAGEQGVVHRDLKPANLFLSAEGLIKVGDFGLARDMQMSRLTATGLTVGTWKYMAPEQIVGADDIGPRVDIYALGCILYQMLAGRAPFGGRNSIEVLEQHLKHRPQPLGELNPSVPRRLIELIDQMLEKDPARRPASAAAVAEKLSEIAAREATPAKTDSHDVSVSLADRLMQPAEAREVGWKAIAAIVAGIVLAVAAAMIAQRA